MKIIVALMITIALLLTGCSNVNIDSNGLETELDSSSDNNETYQEISFKDSIITGLKKQNYYVEWNMYGYDVSLQDVHAIFALDLSFFGVGSLIASNIEGLSLSGDSDVFAKSNEYKDCCDTLLHLLNIDASMDDVLETFSEETKRSNIFSNDNFVWYLRHRESTDDFDFYIFDLDSISKCIQSYDLTKWKNFEIKMFEQPTIYSGSKICFSGKLISISNIPDEDYFLKTELLFQLNTGDEVKVVYDFGYFPYTFIINSEYTIYGTISQNKIIFDFFTMSDY